MNAKCSNDHSSGHHPLFFWQYPVVLEHGINDSSIVLFFVSNDNVPCIAVLLELRLILHDSPSENIDTFSGFRYIKYSVVHYIHTHTHQHTQAHAHTQNKF